MLCSLIFTFIVAGGICFYQLIKPPPSPKCGSVNGPPVTSLRIRLCDGRYLAYKARGAANEIAKYKVILNHGFFASKDNYLPVSNEWLQEMGILLVTFDRPGYGESDPNSSRSPKSDALDIQEFADNLDLGPKFFVIGFSAGSYPAWGCLKFIPHRLAGVVLVVPTVNYWWPSLPAKLCSRAYNKLLLMERLRLWFIHHAPKLAWLMQQWLNLPTVDVLKNNPKAFHKSDVKILLEVPVADKEKIVQQGVYESLHRDFVVTYGSWEFDPLELTNPFPENSSSLVHLWIGHEDGIVARELLQHIAQRLSWIRTHEIPDAGHFFFKDKKYCEMVFKSLVFGD